MKIRFMNRGNNYWNYITEKYFFITVMILSTLMRLHYISFISVYDMQHDVGTPGTNYGHLGYISYLLTNGHLPDFDVREAFQFWHPPLHHYISALFLKIIWTVFPSQNGNYESIQLLPLIYISISLWIIWKMLHLWKFHQKVVRVVFSLMAFHPTFIILSGSVNNDALCVMFSMVSIYLALLWYQNPQLKTIVAAALAIGLGMSAKGTTAIAAFPMAFIFFMGLLKYKKKALLQLFIFGMISLPLGMWWYIRNYYLFGVPINYIYRTSTDAIGYLGEIPIWKRVLDFDPRRFGFWNFYIQFEGKFLEVNPVIALLKSAVYAQCWFNYNVYIRIIAYPLIFIWIFLTGCSLYAIPSFFRRRKELRMEVVCIIILFVIQFISYYSFCLEYPFVWTMDIRYAVLLLLAQALFIAEFIETHPKWKKWINRLVAVFILITVLVFFLFSFTSFG